MQVCAHLTLAKRQSDSNDIPCPTRRKLLSCQFLCCIRLGISSLARLLLSTSSEMRVAIPTWQESVSPVLDVARNLLLVDIDAGAEQERRLESLSETGVLARAGRLKAMFVNVLICGAVSWPLERALVSAGIEVIPHVCGNVDDVLHAYLTGRLWDRAFLMPGCNGCRQRCRRGFAPKEGT